MLSRENPSTDHHPVLARHLSENPRRIFLLIALLFLSSILNAQDLQNPDSLASPKKNAQGEKGYLLDSTVIPPKTKGRLIKAFIVPVAIGGLALLSESHKYQVRTWRNENFPHFKTMSDDAIQYAPMVAVYALNGLGVRGKNDVPNATALMLKGAVMTTALFFVFKYTQHELRPDGSDFASFPSGHTEQAFAAATFLHKEYGHRSVWYTIAGYTVATGVGAMRILNNKHWLPDVLVGAAAGILAVNLVYLNHKYRWGRNYVKKKRNQALILPTYRKGPGIYFCLKFK